MKSMPRASRLAPLLAAFSLSCIACSSADDEPKSAGNPVGDETPDGSGGEPGDTPGDPPPLGNDCGIHSGYPGDELCLLPPEPSEGIQLHVGAADYDDPDTVAPYLLEAGGENVVCFNDLAEAGGFYYFAQENHMRSGSHHMLIGLQTAEGRSEGPTTDCDLLSRIGSVPGSQTPINVFPEAEIAPEDEGLARWFPEGAMANFQLHYVNTTTEPVMREAWVNVYFKDEASVTDKLNSVFLVGDFAVDVAPGEREITKLAYAPQLPESTRIYELTGHAHAHTERFSVWHTSGGVRGELLYETYDWAEPSVLTYNTVTTNAPPDPNGATDGGHTGPLFLAIGEGLEWECEVNNTSDGTLNFANEAYTAEMCLLAGAYVSDTAGLLAGACTNGACVGFSALGTGR